MFENLFGGHMTDSRGKPNFEAQRPFVGNSYDKRPDEWHFKDQSATAPDCVASRSSAFSRQRQFPSGTEQ